MSFVAAADVGDFERPPRMRATSTSAADEGDFSLDASGNFKGNFNSKPRMNADGR